MDRSTGAGDNNGLAFNERCRAMCELTSDGIVIATPEGQFIEVNPACCAMLGYTRDEILQRAWSDLLVGEALSLDEDTRRECRLRAQGGRELSVEVSSRKLSDGTLLSVLCDTATHRLIKAESDLQKSEERYRLLAENISDVIWVLDITTGRFRYVSPSIMRARGYTVEEALAERMDESLTPESMASIAQMLPSRIADFYAGDARSYSDELEQPCKDGTRRWFEVNSRFVTNEKTGHLEAYGTSRDSSARRQAEAALRESAARLRLAQRCAHLGYIVIHARTQEVFWSDETFEILGYEVHAFAPTPQHFFDRVHPDDAAQMSQEINQLLDQQYDSQREYRIIRPDGEIRWIYGRGETFFDNYGQPLQFIGILQDITERKHAEAALLNERARLAEQVAEQTADLRIANAELARAARLKDEFLASMSHELRTPLNAILGRSELLQEQIYGPLTTRQGEALRSIETSGRHLLELINDILDLSKIEAGKLDLQIGPVNIHALCQASLHLVTQTAAMKQIGVTMTIDGQVRMIMGDERRLKQILVNLLSNAVKFTSAGGSVGLEVHADTATQKVTFSVWDTGIGIAAADLPQLFQPFVQIDSGLNRQYTGTGLGLALVRRLTLAHDGNVSVDSTPGQGSRFSVTLPWIDVSPPALEEMTGPTDSPVPQLGRALVIEDSHLAAEQITRYLNELGIHVEIHMQASGAIERAISTRPDVIVLDIMLPDEPGWTVLRRLKADPRTSAIPVIVASIVDQPAYSRALGAAAHLAKPINRDALIEVLHRVATIDRGADIHAALLIVSQPEEAARPRLRILLAEDNDEQSQIVSEYLRIHGYDVALARNGSEALALIQEVPPAAIVMDIQMPGMDGLEAIRRIRADARMRHVPIIALTALAMAGDQDRCLEAGADAYLSKPVSLKLLVQAIDTRIR